MRGWTWVAAGLAAAAVAASGLAALAAATPEAVAMRRASMHEAGEVMRGLRLDILAHRPIGPLEARARWVDAWAGKVVALFPPGSGEGDTLALATVWTDSAGFAALAARLGETTRNLVAASRASDPAGFRAAYMAVDDACNQCHRAFRKR